MSSPERAIQIYVRSPNSSIPKDYHITTTPEANIASIKQQIHDTLETRPNLEDQRLIFQGKILANEEVIKNVFKKVDLSTSQIFHLVVKSGVTSEPQPKTSAFGTQPSSSTYGVSSTNSFFRHRFQSQFDESFENSFYQAPSVSPSVTTGPTLTTSQNTAIPPPLVTILGLTGHYQYVLINGQPYLMQMPNQVPPNIVYPMNYDTGIANPLQAAEPLMAQVPPNLIPPQLNGAQGNRQAAHSIWLVFRLVFFAYLFGQGASFERMILISLVCMVVYLYQTGRLRVVRVQINQLNPRNPPDIFPPNLQNLEQPVHPNPIQPQLQPQPQPQQQQVQPQQVRQTSQQDVQPQEPPRDTLGILKVAIFTFFRSIIPTDQIRDIPPEDVENDMF